MEIWYNQLSGKLFGIASGKQY